jgi:hypothetical protein
MREVLFALALASALPAQAEVYEFTGTCTSQQWMGGGSDPLDIGCADIVARIQTPDDYVPGTSFGYESEGSIQFLTGVLAGFSPGFVDGFSGILPSQSGAGEVWGTFDDSTLNIYTDGDWVFNAGDGFNRPGWDRGSVDGYRWTGTGGTFQLIFEGNVPLPGTAALLGLGLFVASRRGSRGVR